MSLLTKILLAVGGVALFGALVFVIYNQHQTLARQDAIQQQLVAQQQLADNITRSMAEWATKADLQNLSSQYGVDLQAIQSNLDKLNANVNAVNVAVANSVAQRGTNVGSTSTTPNGNTAKPTVDCDGKQIPCPDADPFGYLENKQVFQLNEQFATVKVPFGTVTFDAAQQKPWSYDIPSREYDAVTVLGTDENQRTFAYNRFSVKVNGNSYAIPINKSEIEQIYPSAKFSFWNPRIFLGVDSGIDIGAVKGMLGPSLALQIMSYGKYKTQPDISVLQLGVGFDGISKKVDFLLTPVLYNIGQHIPLMSNLYIGPTLGYNISGNLSVQATLRVGL